MVQHIEKLPEKARLKIFIWEKKKKDIHVKIIQHLHNITVVLFGFFLKFRTHKLVESEPQLCHLRILVNYEEDKLMKN